MIIDIISNLEKNVAGLKAALASTNFECKFIHTDLAKPHRGQAVWVRHRNGAEYRLTYPFNHEDYPLWYPLPKD
jgi:hypothetical protein